MNVKKATLSVAIAAALGLTVSVSQAAIIDMDYSGLFTMLDPDGLAVQSTAYPFYGDPTWGYGFRTQISGTMTIDTNAGTGTTTIAPFEFFDGGHAVISPIGLQSIGNSLILANMDFTWRTNNITTQFVLDGKGLFSALAGGLPTVGEFLDQSYCVSSNQCSSPASDGIRNGKYPIGPVPIATSSYNVNGATGTSTTLAQLSLGSDDGIGGSPMDNGPFPGFNVNLDVTYLEVTAISAVPVPAAVWLFGSGLVALAGVARRRRA